MKVHLVGKETSGGGVQALESWEKENLIPYKTKCCTGLMMSRGKEAFFTDDLSKVTCGLCIRRWNKFLRKQKKTV